MIPPVSKCARAFSVMAERKTASDHSPPPSAVCGSDQSCQNFVTVSRTVLASMGPGIGQYEGDQVSEKGTSSPSLTRNSATVAIPSPRTSAGVVSVNRSGPATAGARPSVRRGTHGTTEPYSGRMMSSIRIYTRRNTDQLHPLARGLTQPLIVQLAVPEIVQELRYADGVGAL